MWTSDMNMKRYCKDDWQARLNYMEKTCPIDILIVTYHTMTAYKLNLGLHCEKWHLTLDL